MERTYNDGAPKVMLMHAWQDKLELNEKQKSQVKLLEGQQIDIMNKIRKLLS